MPDSAKTTAKPLCPAIEIVVVLLVGAVGLPLEPPQAVKVRATAKAPYPATKLQRIVTFFA